MQRVNVFFSTDEVGVALHLKSTTVTKYIRSGQLEAEKVGRQYLVTPDALRQWTQLNHPRLLADIESIIQDKKALSATGNAATLVSSQPTDGTPPF